MTRELTLSEANVIAGGFNTTNASNFASMSKSTGYIPPYNPDTEPLRAGIADIGGYANNYIKQYTGFDLTGDSVTYNKLFGGLIFIAVTTLPLLPIVFPLRR